MADRPNILLIQSDQHRYDCTGLGATAHGDEPHPGRLAQTPAIDRLGAEGVWFSHAFTSTPTCCPARQSLLCGKWPEVHGGLWNYGTGIPEQLFDQPTWTQSLAAGGYSLGYVGRWEVHPAKGPQEYGFSEWIEAKDYAAWRRQQGLPGYEHGDDPWFGGRDPAPVEQSKTHWYADQTISLIRRYSAEGRPWHIRLDFDEPHLPCYPAGRFAAMYAPEGIPPWGSFGEQFSDKPYIQRQQLVTWGLENLTWDDWRVFVARYLGVVSQVDDAIGRVLAALDGMGLAAATLVIYTTDHGENCGGHRMIDKHYVMYDDVVHVPLVARWPGVIPGGMVCDEFVVHTLDLASTICEAVGLRVPDDYQGRSLWPLLRGDTPADWRQDAVSTYHGAQFGLYEQRMLRDRKYKYVWNATDVDELYDLVRDPWELRNVANRPENAGVLRDMRQRLLAQLVEHGDGLVRTDWMRRQLAEGRKVI